MISSVQTNVHSIYACVARDFDLRCFLEKPGILDRSPVSLSRSYPACLTRITANISNAATKRVTLVLLEPSRAARACHALPPGEPKACRPTVSASGLRESSRRTRRIRLKIYLQSSWEKALPARRYTPRRPLSGALGVQLPRLCERPLSVDENRRKNGQFSKIELKLYKTKWRLRFGPKSKQLTFADEQRCECPF
jgi:hypothetical protein